MINRSHWAFSAPASRLLHLPPLQNPNVTEEPQFTKSKIEIIFKYYNLNCKKIFSSYLINVPNQPIHYLCAPKSCITVLTIVSLWQLTHTLPSDSWLTATAIPIRIRRHWQAYYRASSGTETTWPRWPADRRQARHGCFCRAEKCGSANHRE